MPDKDEINKPDKDEVSRFARMIGATRMVLQTTSNERRLFSRRNYFEIPTARLIIKISRLERPFWGVGVQQIEVLEKRGVYFLILLTSVKQGWFLSHAEIQELRSGPKTACWSRGTDENEYQYKINPPLPNSNWFNSPEEFLEMIGRLLR